MSKTTTFVIAGFGGQGVLFCGKVISYSGMLADLQVSWLPSYGPEMRGGTANCSVTISDDQIGSPLVLDPDILVVLNNPSFEKFEKSVKAGGTIIMDNSLITLECSRTDVKVFKIPATKIANENNLKGLGNMIVLGKLLKETGFIEENIFFKALEKCIPPSKPQMLELNKKAIALGFDY